MDRRFLPAAHALRLGVAVLLALPGGPLACAPRTGAMTEIVLPAQTPAQTRRHAYALVFLHLSRERLPLCIRMLYQSIIPDMHCRDKLHRKVRYA